LTFLAWSLYLRLLQPPPEAVVGEPPLESFDSSKGGVTQETREEPAESEPERPLAAVEEVAERVVVVETPLYRATFSNRGGELVSLTLTQHKDQSGNPLELVPQEASRRIGVRPLQVVAPTEKGFEGPLYQVSQDGLSLGPGERGNLEFTWSDGKQLEAVKQLEFSGESYEIGVKVSLRRAGSEVAKQVQLGPGLEEEAISGSYVQPDKGVILGANELRLITAEEVGEKVSASVDVEAVGLASHYFTGLLIAPEGSGYGASLTRTDLEVGAPKKKRGFITAALVVPTGPAHFRMYMGPKDREIMAQLGHRLEEVVEFGRLAFLVLPLRRALLWTYGLVGNFGWAIVVLTVGINVALSPLKHYSYVSMRKMQALQPQVKRIQERFKKLKPTDPRRKEMNLEVMALYKEHKVSPFSGCLPILVMIPFFFAFYNLLAVSIELRHAPFIWWVKDLSGYDPYFVLPILMGVSQLVIQKMTPQTTADPVQAKMMMIMPVVFMFFFIWAPAGLVLYWFVNNLVSVAQQVMTNRLVGPAPVR
jgi:YidC/Oxa1 family membrane protein insertase